MTTSKDTDKGMAGVELVPLGNPQVTGAAAALLDEMEMADIEQLKYVPNNGIEDV